MVGYRGNSTDPYVLHRNASAQVRASTITSQRYKARNIIKPSPNPQFVFRGTRPRTSSKALSARLAPANQGAGSSFDTYTYGKLPAQVSPRHRGATSVPRRPATVQSSRRLRKRRNRIISLRARSRGSPRHSPRPQSVALGRSNLEEPSQAAMSTCIPYQGCANITMEPGGLSKTLLRSCAQDGTRSIRERLGGMKASQFQRCQVITPASQTSMGHRWDFLNVPLKEEKVAQIANDAPRNVFFKVSPAHFNVDLPVGTTFHFRSRITNRGFTKFAPSV